MLLEPSEQIIRHVVAILLHICLHLLRLHLLRLHRLRIPLRLFSRLRRRLRLLLRLGAHVKRLQARGDEVVELRASLPVGGPKGSRALRPRTAHGLVALAGEPGPVGGGQCGEADAGFREQLQAAACRLHRGLVPAAPKWRVRACGSVWQRVAAYGSVWQRVAAWGGHRARQRSASARSKTARSERPSRGRPRRASRRSLGVVLAGRPVHAVEVGDPQLEPEPAWPEHVLHMLEEQLRARGRMLAHGRPPVAARVVARLVG